MNKELADLLFPHINKDREYYEGVYPKRDMVEGSVVTRYAPSPTGFVHIGNIYSSYLCTRMAKQNNGVFFVRVEDTDGERTVENGIENILTSIANFNIVPDESSVIGGEYGPYIQSERKEIYQTFIKELVELGHAYPCFCTEDKLNEIRKGQELNKERLGYYSRYALCRSLSFDDIKRNLEEGIPYVIRLKSPGDFNKSVTVSDLIKGDITFPENDLDIVIMKKDGLPTYHFAHAIDDHFMRVTHVIRGDEWVSSLPTHVQLFDVLNFERPEYAHVAPLTKKENGNTRKLSKRKDPEFSVSYYHEMGIPNEAVKLYLMTIANYDFEEWYIKNPTESIENFTLDFSKMPVGGTLFDVEKLNSVSKIYFSKLKAIDLYDDSLKYYEEYDKEFAKLMKDNKEVMINFLNIEREVERPRKDIGKYSDIKSEFSYVFDELFEKDEANLDNKDKYSTEFLSAYLDVYNENDSKEEWFNKVKEVASNYGYATDNKDYKANPDKYVGNVAAACEMIRVAVTNRTMTPDLYEILKLLGRDTLISRSNKFIDKLKALN